MSSHSHRRLSFRATGGRRAQKRVTGLDGSVIGSGRREENARELRGLSVARFLVTL